MKVRKPSFTLPSMDRDYETAKTVTPASNTQAAKPTSKAASSVEPQQSAKAPKTTPEVINTCWETVELDYRAGIKTLRLIASEQGISEGAIRKRAKRDEWSRDLKAKIQERAEVLVRNRAVRNEVRKERASTEKAVIEANACAIVEVRLSQRTDIQRSRRVSMALLEELEAMVGRDTAELMYQLGDLMRSPDDKGMDRLNDLYRKIISLPERAKTMKDLGESLRVLVALERQAFGLDDKDNQAVDSLTSLLHGIASRNNNGFTPVANDPEHADEDD